MKEKREFFRGTGMVYLHVTPKHAQVPVAAGPEPADALDPLAIKLMNFRARLEYADSPHVEPMRELVRLLEEMYGAMAGARHGALPLATRQPVNISGSGLQFFSDTPFAVGNEVLATISFPAYPHSTVSCEAVVVRVDQSQAPHRRAISLRFQNIRESDRDQIVQYVNYLQRQQLASRTADRSKAI